MNIINGTKGLVTVKHRDGGLSVEPAHFYDGQWKLDYTLKKPEILGWMPYPLPGIGGTADWKELS